MGIIEKAAGRIGAAKHEAPADADKAQAAPPLPPAPPAVEQALLNSPRSQSKRVELDLEKLRSLGMVTPDVGRSAVAEEFRAIKRTLLDHVLSPTRDMGKHSNLIMVTSSLPGEGKTFCATNLAMSIATEVDRTVLLIDADVARPSVLSGLGLKPAHAGLMDLLLERDVHVADVMLRTNIDGLSILPAGTSHRHATELLASQAMSRLLDEIATRYADRIVIFDSPPLLLTSEARVLASQMGQIVMVVEAERTTQNAVKNALLQLEDCPNINLVYNKSQAFSGSQKYGYYSYYN
ncbi:MAG: tyrosine-protein kinase family protein [Noviherbaspirillum sp.]|nr:tyrosine-protein kinase family protein [Noviherbaspirillum sp.]